MGSITVPASLGLNEQNSHSDVLLWVSLMAVVAVAWIVSWKVVRRNRKKMPPPSDLPARRQPSPLDYLTGDHDNNPWS